MEIDIKPLWTHTGRLSYIGLSKTVRDVLMLNWSGPIFIKHLKIISEHNIIVIYEFCHSSFHDTEYKGKKVFEICIRCSIMLRYSSIKIAVPYLTNIVEWGFKFQCASILSFRLHNRLAKVFLSGVSFLLTCLLDCLCIGELPALVILLHYLLF